MTSTCIYNNDNCFLLILRKINRIKMCLKIYLVDNQHCERATFHRHIKVNALHYHYFNRKNNCKSSIIIFAFYLFQVTNCAMHSGISLSKFFLMKIKEREREGPYYPAYQHCSKLLPQIVWGFSEYRIKRSL